MSSALFSNRAGQVRITVRLTYCSTPAGSLFNRSSEPGAGGLGFGLRTSTASKDTPTARTMSTTISPRESSGTKPVAGLPFGPSEAGSTEPTRALDVWRRSDAHAEVAFALHRSPRAEGRTWLHSAGHEDCPTPSTSQLGSDGLCGACSYADRH